MIAFPFHWDSKAYGSDQVFVGPNGTSSLQMNFYTTPFEKGWGREERVRRGTTKVCVLHKLKLLAKDTQLPFISMYRV
jgi:hypothetical protein